MKRQPPIYTYYAIIGASLLALAFSHLRQIPGEEAMPLFIIAMAVGVVAGEIIERWQRKSRAG